MTSECNPPSASKRHLQAINILEEKHAQDIQKREGEFQARIDQLRSDAKQEAQAVILNRVEEGVSEEKGEEERVERVKMIGIEGQLNYVVGVDEAMGVLEIKEIGVEEGKMIEEYEEEIKRSEEIEQLLRTELQQSDDEIRNLRYEISRAALLTTSHHIMSRTTTLHHLMLFYFNCFYTTHYTYCLVACWGLRRSVRMLSKGSCWIVKRRWQS